MPGPHPFLDIDGAGRWLIIVGVAIGVLHFSMLM